MTAVRRAGQHARERTRALALRALAGIAAAVVVGLIVGLAHGFLSWSFVLAEIGVIAVCVAIDRFAVPGIERRDRGATGEEYVGKILDGLAGDGWRVVHDLDTGRGNIDHVLVGPGGVFTVETKSHGGKISADRIEEAWLKQAYAQAKHVEALLGARVSPLLVFSRAYLSRPVIRRRGVTALPARMVAGHLARYTPSLAPGEVEALHARLAG
jgi:hypothetical protein